MERRERLSGQEEKIWERVSFLAEENHSQQEMINHLYRITVSMDKRIDYLEGRIKELEREDDGK